jgi:hypothetical protein
MPEENGLQGGWFIAKVLTMTPKEALVVYDDLMTDDGLLSFIPNFFRILLNPTY